MCVAWAASDPWVAHVMRAVGWSNAGQPVGMLGSLPPALVDGLLTVRAEWDAIHGEELKRK